MKKKLTQEEEAELTKAVMKFADVCEKLGLTTCSAFYIDKKESKDPTKYFSAFQTTGKKFDLTYTKKPKDKKWKKLNY